MKPKVVYRECGWFSPWDFATGTVHILPNGETMTLPNDRGNYQERLLVGPFATLRDAVDESLRAHGI